MSSSDEVVVKTEVFTFASIAGVQEESSSDEEPETQPLPVLYLSHGGGPCFFLDAKTSPMVAGMDKDSEAAQFYRDLGKSMEKPLTVLVVSAHWEEDRFTITSHEEPPLVYDYYGFPDEAYDMNYPIKGDVKLAKRLARRLAAADIRVKRTRRRGYDHGVFIPLKLMFPDADIPVLQISLNKSLDPEQHIKLGQALAPLREQGVLIIGSGQTTHSFREMGDPGLCDDPPKWAVDFDNWLTETVTAVSGEERLERLRRWEELAPNGRRAHPREEHLIPLMVAAGAAIDPIETLTPARKLFGAWVLESMSLTSYIFETPREAFRPISDASSLEEDPENRRVFDWELDEPEWRKQERMELLAQQKEERRAKRFEAHRERRRERQKAEKKRQKEAALLAKRRQWEEDAAGGGGEGGEGEGEGEAGAGAGAAAADHDVDD